MRPKIIALDFDGTCVENVYPAIGFDIGAAYWVKRAQENYNIRIILWTMRTGKELAAAQAWLEEKGIDIWAVCHNPTQARWSKSPKIYANCYIEDTALGTPLTYSLQGRKPFVNWYRMGPLLEDWLAANAERRKNK